MLIALVFYFVLTLCSTHIPFFWDSVIYNQISQYYYDSDFSSLVLPVEIEPSGSPMIYWMYLASVWKIFGKSLAISHWAVFPFLFGIVWEYYKFSKRFLRPSMIPWAMLLLIVEPTLLTQSIYMTYDISKLYFFLLALNALLSGRNYLYFIAVTLLVFSSARGQVMAGSLLIIHFLISRQDQVKNSIREMAGYILPVLLLGCWMTWHYYATGWILFSPDSDFASDQEVRFIPEMMVRKALYVLWQIADFGRVFMGLAITIGIIFLFKKKKITGTAGTLLTIVCVSIIIYVFLFSFISTPSGHRYYIHIFLCSSILVCYLLEVMAPPRKLIAVIMTALITGLITGNLWMYSGGFSNGWDSSLKSLPYFSLQKEMIEFVKKEKIDPAAVGTEFPLYFDLKHSNLAAESFHFTDQSGESQENFVFILQSNISNKFTAEERRVLEEEWELIKEVRKGQVYLKLFKNPEKN